MGMRFEAIKRNFVYFLKQKRKVKANETKNKSKKNQNCSILAYTDNDLLVRLIPEVLSSLGLLQSATNSPLGAFESAHDWHLVMTKSANEGRTPICIFIQ